MNARIELINHVAETRQRTVKYVRIVYGEGSENARVIAGSWGEVLPQLDFEYNEGFGEQQLYGYVWYADGTWSERCEYDGMEWWEYKRCPDMPEEAK